MTTFARAVRPGADIAAIARHLDELGHDQRVAEVRSLARAQVGQLYELATGRACSLAHFVPAGVAAGQPVRHFGLNSLAIFRTFEKRFMRSPQDPSVGWGYNHQLWQWFTGPGYFVVRDVGCAHPDGLDEREQLFINYYEVADQQPAGWPALRDNNGLPASLVYGKMCDYMWRVSEHVSVGAAYKEGKAYGAFFVLCREA